MENGGDEEFERTLTFFSDQQLCYADVLPPSQVIARIEVAVVNFLRTLTSPATPALPHLPLSPTRNSEPVILQVMAHIRYSDKTSNEQQPSKSRVWKVMEMCFNILRQEKQVTQRELYYMLICTTTGYFSSQLQVNKAIQDVVSLLRCSRHSLGIMASSRGLLAGRVVLQEPNKAAVDCAACGPSGYPITGDLSILQNLVIQTDARYIILVEKHAIFQRMAEDGLFNQIPSVLITAKGYPDIATRYLLHRLSQSFPNLPILAVVDWNPAGLAILSTFKYGSIEMGLEAFRYACNVKWLGIRGEDLNLIPEESLAPLKPKDLQVAKSLMSLGFIPESYKEELMLMMQRGQRAEIESLYYHGYDFLGKYLVKKILQVDYI